MSGRKEYARAPEVEAIAGGLIDLCHPHLHGVRIEYLWTNKPPVVGGRPRAAVMRKVTGLYAFLATSGAEGEPRPFFVMEVCRPIWLARSAEWRVALVDHELKHGGHDEERGTLFIVPHDIEDFDDVVARHGAWDDGLVSFAAALAAGEEGKTPPASDAPLRNNRYQRHAVSEGAKRKSAWKAAQVQGAH
ncbi:MAG TPA: putative metallopeptidase [Pyrinomonadaceae bacterium]|jgi:hypothetical protein|nr:putative metallopeptidase [Pyrinomonadaceae bacterium]